MGSGEFCTAYVWTTNDLKGGNALNVFKTCLELVNSVYTCTDVNSVINYLDFQPISHHWFTRDQIGFMF